MSKNKKTLVDRVDSVYGSSRKVFEIAAGIGVTTVMNAAINSIKPNTPTMGKWYGKLMWSIGSMTISGVVGGIITQKALESADEQHESFRSLLLAVQEALNEEQTGDTHFDEFHFSSHEEAGFVFLKFQEALNKQKDAE